MTPFLHPTFLISILVALSVHEWAHAFTARQLGDPTAEEQGRLTLNPIAHIDPLGAILFLTVGFGWGKPVPIDPRYFRRPRRDTALVAIAGPVSNLLLATICFVTLAALSRHGVADAWSLLDLPTAGSPWRTIAVQILQSSLFLNLGLMAFNLLPVAPLDGSNVLHAFIPERYEDAYVAFLRYGSYVLLALLLGERLFGLPLLTVWISWIMDAALRALSLLAGAIIAS